MLLVLLVRCSRCVCSKCAAGRAMATGALSKSSVTSTTVTVDIAFPAWLGRITAPARVLEPFGMLFLFYNSLSGHQSAHNRSRHGKTNARATKIRSRKRLNELLCIRTKMLYYSIREPYAYIQYIWQIRKHSVDDSDDDGSIAGNNN